jgi:DtxR family Mn-dependent transcriptional regulator
VEERLVELLGHPTTCPHGNPIPGSGAGSASELVALSSLAAGAHVKLERVTEQVEIDLEALSYLSVNGFVPGTDARVAARAPDGTLTLELGEHSFALGPGLAQQLYVLSG